MTFSKISKTVMLLAAGLGTRLRPLTEHTPKPLIELGDGLTLLDYHLRVLKNTGFDHVIVNTHYLSEQIHDHLQKHSPLPYTISHEGTLLGSGGGIANVVHKFGDMPFLVVNSDAFTTGNLVETILNLIETFDPSSMDALLLYANRSSTRGFSPNPDFFMRHNITIPCIPQAKERIEYLGLQILKPALFEGRSGVFSVFDIWHELVLKNRLYGCIDEDGICFETGHVEGLEMARAAFKDHPQIKASASI